MRTRLPVALVALLAAGAIAAQEPAAPAPSASDAAAAAPTTVTVATTTPPAEVAAGETAHAAAKPGDPASGETKAAACGACHGMDGNSADPQYPKIAGQNERYTARQLQLFKSGERVNPIMQPFATALSPQDMRDLGAFFATKAAMPGTGDEAFKARGQQLFRGGDATAGVPACMACHGPSGHGNPGAAYPAISGQHADYTKAKLIAFRDGLVLGTGDNANSVMAGVAANLSDDDIEALSSYVEGLHRAESHAAAVPAVAAQPAAAAAAAAPVAPVAEPAAAPATAAPAETATPTPSG